MNTYLAKLKAAEFARKRHPEAPSKPSEPGIEGFEGDAGRGFLEKSPSASSLQKPSARPRELRPVIRRDPQKPDPAADAEAWRDRYEERCGILEYDHGLPRPKAEAAAFENIVIEWIDAHPEPSQAGRCAHCGQADTTGMSAVPYGVERGNLAWVHLHCWQHWHQQRRAKAVSALAAMGVGPKGA
jgi:hypothetical protein